MDTDVGSDQGLSHQRIFTSGTGAQNCCNQREQTWKLNPETKSQQKDFSELQLFL